MSIKKEALTGNGSTRYTPGVKATFPQVACVAPYDVITITGFEFADFLNGTSNIIPDADGYMPHLVIRPAPYVQMADPRSSAIRRVADTYGVPANGNIASFPPIRVNFGRVRVPWAANISIEGGDGPGAPHGSILITYLWSRAPWHRDAMPVLSEGSEPNFLTLYNVPRITRIQRPANATTVFNPGGQNLFLDNGPGTNGAVANMGASAIQPERLGPFSFVQCTTSSIDSLTFGVTIS